MSKLIAAISILRSRNYVVICDRYAVASIRDMFVKSFRAEMKKMDTKFANHIKDLEQKSNSKPERKEGDK